MALRITSNITLAVGLVEAPANQISEPVEVLASAVEKVPMRVEDMFANWYAFTPKQRQRARQRAKKATENAEKEKAGAIEEAGSGFFRAKELVASSIVSEDGEGPTPRKVLTRSYPKVRDTALYYQFLRSFKSKHMLRPAYNIDDKDSSYNHFVFKTAVDCSFAEYLAGMDVSQIASGTGKLQRDFTDTVISVHRQVASALHDSHSQGISWGEISAKSIFLRLGGKHPEVFVLLPSYECAAKDGARFRCRSACEANRKEDWSYFGGLLRDTAMKGGMSEQNAHEVFDLVNALCNSKSVRSYRDFDFHPALLLVENKLEFLTNSFELIYKSNKNHFFPPNPRHQISEPLVNESWLIKFDYIIRDLKDDYQKFYRGAREAKNEYNFIRFIRNIIKHIRSHVRLRGQFGDGATFFRFVRVFHPSVFMELLKVVDTCKGQHVTDLKAKLKDY